MNELILYHVVSGQFMITNMNSFSRRTVYQMCSSGCWLVTSVKPTTESLHTRSCTLPMVTAADPVPKTRLLYSRSVACHLACVLHKLCTIIMGNLNCLVLSIIFLNHSILGRRPLGNGSSLLNCVWRSGLVRSNMRTSGTISRQKMLLSWLKQ